MVLLVKDIKITVGLTSSTNCAEARVEVQFFSLIFRSAGVQT